MIHDLPTPSYICPPSASTPLRQQTPTSSQYTRPQSRPESAQTPLHPQPAKTHLQTAGIQPAQTRPQSKLQTPVRQQAQGSPVPSQSAPNTVYPMPHANAEDPMIHDLPTTSYICPPSASTPLRQQTPTSSQYTRPQSRPQSAETPLHPQPAKTHLQTAGIQPAQTRPQSRLQTPVRQQAQRSQVASQSAPNLVYPMPHAKFQKKVINLLVQIRNSVNNLVPPTTKTSPQTEGSPVFLEICDCLSDLEEFERQLENRSVRRNVIQQLARVGGTKVSSNVQNVLNRLMSNSLMAQFNLKGNKGKRSIMDLEIYKVVRDSVMISQPSCNEAEITTAVSAHLKYAPDRRGGGGRGGSGTN
ncbi:protein transport protein SEC24 isoform X2 [Patella vulgata]|nr:protein transport protein SEC24 isoform X2 [Patella vulgata]